MRIRSRPLQILIADRHRVVAESLGRVIQSLGDVEIAATPRSADEALAVGSKVAPDIAIVNLELTPDCSLISALCAMSPATRVIAMVHRETSAPHSLVEALTCGAVGAISAESSIEELRRVLGSSPSAPVVPAEATGLLLGSYIEALSEKRRRDLATIEALATAVEARDVGTGRHQERVTELAARCLALLDADLAHNDGVGYGFMLHDVGKIGVADSILNKPGPLVATEWHTMRRHPEMGVKIVEPVGLPHETTEIILHHHERWDGAGYPHGLRERQIPLAARTFSVADAFDAMTSHRPYREAMSRGAALRIIRAESAGAFDPEIVEAFGSMIDLQE